MATAFVCAAIADDKQPREGKASQDGASFLRGAGLPGAGTGAAATRKGQPRLNRGRIGNVVLEPVHVTALTAEEGRGEERAHPHTSGPMTASQIPSRTRYASPLRYPGGKARMAPWLTGTFESLQWPMDVEIWLEPFGGGAGAALTALTSGKVPEAWIVEANPALAAFWTTVMDEGPALASQVEGVIPSLGLFQASREKVAAALNGEKVETFELGLAAFILNRCSRSGMIISNVGPIGGKTQSGRDTISARFNAPALAERIRAVHALGDRFKVFTGDGISFLEDLPSSGILDEVFCFVDPPYIGVGNDLYAIGMDNDLHERLARALNRLTAPWLLTYDAHPQIPVLYPCSEVMEFDIPHTAGSSRVGTEYLVLGPGMRLPETNPLGRGSVQLLAA